MVCFFANEVRYSTFLWKCCFEINDILKFLVWVWRWKRGKDLEARLGSFTDLHKAAVEELMQHGIDLNLDEVVFLLIFIFLLQRILTKLWWQSWTPRTPWWYDFACTIKQRKFLLTKLRKVRRRLYSFCLQQEGQGQYPHVFTAEENSLYPHQYRIEFIS